MFPKSHVMWKSTLGSILQMIKITHLAQHFIVQLFSLKIHFFFIFVESWDSEVSNRRPGIDFSPSSMNAADQSSSPLNEFTSKNDNVLRSPNSVLSE